MAMDIGCGKGNLNPRNILELLKYKIQFNIEHPDYFDADGLLCFVGGQGSGKTLSAVNYVYKLMEKYPNSILCTNLMLTDYPVVTFEEYLRKPRMDKWIESVRRYAEDVGESEEWVKAILYDEYLKSNRVFPFMDNDDLTRYGNDERGCIFFIDEIQLYMNSLESKNINMDTMTQISQQRKQRKHIVCTSQVFGRMAKPLREQFSSVIACKCILKTLQYNSLIDRDDLDNDTSSDTNVTGVCKQRFIWFHNPKMYKRYDTYYVIEKGKFVSNDDKKGDIYGTELSNNS